MARKAGQGKEEEESRARQQEEKTPVRDEEKKPACHGRRSPCSGTSHELVIFSVSVQGEDKIYKMTESQKKVSLKNSGSLKVIKEAVQ
ncbi:hypothetical protein STEG23_024452 [Scotinomys teguina]